MYQNFKHSFICWFYLFKSASESRNRYQVSMVSYLLSQVVRLFAIILIWYVALGDQSNFAFKEIFTYYIIGEIFIFEPSPHYLLETEIVRGSLANRLLRPANIWFSLWVEYAGRYFILDLTKVFLGIITFIIGYNYMILPVDLASFGFFILACVISYLINLLLSYIIGFSSFYFGYIYGVAELVSQIKSLFSGKLLPLNSLSFLNNLKILPFALTYFIPLQIYLNKLNQREIFFYLTCGLIWLIILYSFATLIYKKGMEKFESVGI